MPTSAKVATIANGVVSILLCVGAFVLTQLLSSLRDTADNLREADERLASQISAVQVLVTGYVTRDEFRHEIERINDAIDKLRK